MLFHKGENFMLMSGCLSLPFLCPAESGWGGVHSNDSGNGLAHEGYESAAAALFLLCGFVRPLCLQSLRVVHDFTLEGCCCKGSPPYQTETLQVEVCPTFPSLVFVRSRCKRRNT